MSGTGGGRCALARRLAGRAQRMVGTMTLTSGPASSAPARRAAKRALDITVASLLLVLAVPVFLAVAVAIEVESRGPVLYRARRTGYRFAPVAVLKFRKMRQDASGPPLTAHDDDRLTRVGAVLARTHLDELPQLWNVLRGEMSLVGPRPEDPRFTALHERAYERIVSVRPGLTGCAQLVWVDERELLSSAQNRVASYVDDLLPRKVALDVAYAADRRLATDVKLLLWTPLVLLLGFAVVVDGERPELRLVRRAPERPTGGAGAEAALPEPDLVEETAG
jgi:lipopolysaccharide/colanic/teichoic acid biosynthesis glycosyltransferase